MRIISRVTTALFITACIILSINVHAHAAPAASAAPLTAGTGLHYHSYSDRYFGVLVPNGWVVRDGRYGIEVSSPTGAARYEFGYAYGGPVGRYSLAKLTNLAIAGLQLQRVQILKGPATVDINSERRVQTTELQGWREGQLILAVITVQIIDNANGEAIIGETMSAPAAQWRTYQPELSRVQRSLRVLG